MIRLVLLLLFEPESTRLTCVVLCNHVKINRGIHLISEIRLMNL